MILLVAFAFLAGVVTILSPCILPILPIILSSTIGGKVIGKSRPIGVITGFIASFTFFTLFLSTLVQVSGVSADSLRLFAVVVIAGFGISFLIPSFQTLLEKLFSSLSRLVPQGNTGTDFWSGLFIGLSIGLLWTPCVGPILASVISLAITGTVSFDAFIITFAYALGTAIPMFAILIGGQNLLRKIPWLLSNTAKIQKIFGVIMILTALAIFNNLDRKFQTFILQTFPQYGVGLTQFEDNQKIREELDKLHGTDPTNTPTIQKDDLPAGKQDMGKPMFDLLAPKGALAPEIIPGGEWLNSKPLQIAELKGKVILVDFWTYSCINCQRTFPYLKKWHEMYKDKGLVIIGVHAPEFEFEKNKSNVEQALKDFGLTYPVVQDNNFATWRAYDNHYWPAKYIIDKDGYIRYSHFGEGDYDETEQVIQELLKETGAKDLPTQIKNNSYTNYGKTPETYLGYWRIDNFASNEHIANDQLTTYTAPASVPNDNVAYVGKWKVARQYANPQKGASLLLNFDAKEVFLVMRPTDKTPGKVKVFLDNKPQYLGEDATSGTVTITGDKLYKLINLPTPGRHMLKLEFEDTNTELYAFTFG
ncbi:MAG: cytochrome c biogenesis protein DipZ [Patescibacteria group bacterium]